MSLLTIAIAITTMNPALTCAIVDPVQNTVHVVRYQEGYGTRYWDRGDHIDYAVPVPPLAQRLVTQQRGKAKRFRCGR